MELNKKKTALVFGTIAGVWHVLWSALVGLGWAQSWMDFVFSMHFLENPLIVGAFSFGTALGLVALTFALGCVFGWIFASVWNTLHRQQ